MKESNSKTMSNNITNEHEIKKEEPKQEWLLTYADMMTLLFAFFVMMYSMSSPDPVKMSQIQDAMQKEAGKEGTIQSQNEIKQEINKNAIIISTLDKKTVSNIKSKLINYVS